MNRMYRKGQAYKIELETGIYYTGIIIDADENSLLIETQRGEEVILSKKGILRATKLDSKGEIHETNKDNKR